MNGQQKKSHIRASLICFAMGLKPTQIKLDIEALLCINI